MYPWRASSRRGDGDVPARLGPVGGELRQHHHRPLARRDRRSPTRSRWPSGSGDRLRHVHLTDGTGSAKDEHLVPGPRHADAPGFLEHLAGARLRRPHRARDQHPQGRPPRGARGRPAWSRWSSPASTSSVAPDADERVRRAAAAAAGPGAPDTRGRDPGRGAERLRRPGLRRYDDPRGRRRRRRRPGARAPLLRHQGRPVPRRAGAPGRPARAWSARSSPAGSTGAGERLLRRLPLGLGRPRDPPPLLVGVARPVLEPGGERLLTRGVPAGGARCRSAQALGIDQPERADAAGGQPDGRA